MDNKLEARIARLERLVYHKAKNESVTTNLQDLAKEIVSAAEANLGSDSGWVVDSTVTPEDFIRIYIEGDNYEISDEHCLVFRVYIDEGNFEVVDEYTVYGHTYQASSIDEVVGIITSSVNNYFAETV